MKTNSLKSLAAFGSLFLFLLAPATRAASPYVSGVLAEIFPGAGYLYQGDTSSGILAGSLIVPLAAPYYWTTPTFALKSTKMNLYTAARNVFGYTVYDSYQSAMSEQDRQEQVVPIPHYKFSELALAPFDSRSYSSWKPFVIIGLGAMGAVSNVAYYGISPNLNPARLLLTLPVIMAQTLLVGVGEESEFRGFQYPAASKLTGSWWLGNALQSLSFGTCHTSWGMCTSPYLTAQIFRRTRGIDTSSEYYSAGSPSDGSGTTDLRYLLDTATYGFYWGWIVHSEPDGLLQTITSHALYDMLLVISDVLTTNNTGRFYLSMSFPMFGT